MTFVDDVSTCDVDDLIVDDSVDGRSVEVVIGTDDRVVVATSVDGVST